MCEILQVQTVKTVADSQDSFRLRLRQLQTVSECQNDCGQLQTIADMCVLVFSVYSGFGPMWIDFVPNIKSTSIHKNKYFHGR